MAKDVAGRERLDAHRQGRGDVDMAQAGASQECEPSLEPSATAAPQDDGSNYEGMGERRDMNPGIMVDLRSMILEET